MNTSTLQHFNHLIIMARTLKEINDDLKAQFMANEALAAIYGIGPGEKFGDHFGKASIEGLIIYILAYCTYTLEYMLSKVEAEIEDMVDRLSPGRPDWYARKLKEYLSGVEWDPGTGEFILDGDPGDDQLERLRIIKHAVAEDSGTGQLVLKIAGEQDGERCPLSQEQESQIDAYIQRIKYAGVSTRLINAQGDTFNCIISIYYDPLLSSAAVEQDCQAAIKQYLQNLPFNGEYSNMALIDAIQQVRGVDIAEMQASSYIIDGYDDEIAIDARVQPYAGYFIPGDITLEMIEH